MLNKTMLQKDDHSDFLHEFHSFPEFVTYDTDKCNKNMNNNSGNYSLEYLHTSENVPVNLFSRVDLPTEGKPTRPTLESPLLVTSKPSPAPPAPFDEGVRSSLRNFANLAWHQIFTNNESTPQQKQQQNTGKQKRNLKSSKKGTTRNKILMILMEG